MGDTSPSIAMKMSPVSRQSAFPLERDQQADCTAFGCNRCTTQALRHASLISASAYLT
jgi:hypothetical protein